MLSKGGRLETQHQPSMEVVRGPAWTVEEKRRIFVHVGDEDFSSIVFRALSESSCELLLCRDFEELREHISSETPLSLDIEVKRLLLWGLVAPFAESLLKLKELRAMDPSVRVVLVAPPEALSLAAEIKSVNADVFMLKPLRSHDLKSGVERAFQRARSVSTAKPVVLTPISGHPPRPESPVVIESGLDLGLVGSSPEMQKVISLIRRVGVSSCNVLVTGESGTGKEMVAQAIHRVSARARRPFVAINCAAIPRELLESELFGHAKGAFTGATTARRGLFEEAHEGTILLDEIGDLPISLQAKILRLLQTKQVKPLGQNTIREVDVRIISATHKNLKDLIQKGEFREDLYYRLNVMPIHLPPLRDRKDDILLLAEYFLRRYATSHKGSGLSLSKKACQKLQSLHWRGNVRELENVIERAIVLANGDCITENEILGEDVEPVRVTTEDLFNNGMSLRDIEKEYIKYVLSRTGNRKEAATRILGIDRKTLYRKEKLYGIRPSMDLS